MKNLLIILGCCVFLHLLYRFIIKIKNELESIDLDDTNEEPYDNKN